MQPGVMEDRPPFIKFEVRPHEDRNASIEAGHYVAVDVDYAVITPAGSKDEIPRIFNEWIEQLTQGIRDGRFKPEYVQAIKGMYEAWKEGLEMPVDGTPIRGWPVLSPSDQENVIAVRIRTVEDLAEANEQTLMSLGIGSRTMKQKAQAWLDSSNSNGKATEKISALQSELKDQKNVNEKLQENLDILMIRLEALESNPVKKTRKKKT
tara:strand:- start:4032 stop:4655 length:624 start_codon:yes stop_codon:yes gene_type:complete